MNSLPLLGFTKNFVLSDGTTSSVLSLYQVTVGWGTEEGSGKQLKNPMVPGGNAASLGPFLI